MSFDPFTVGCITLCGLWAVGRLCIGYAIRLNQATPAMALKQLKADPTFLTFAAACVSRG
jgi:hypothetical protein